MKTSRYFFLVTFLAILIGSVVWANIYIARNFSNEYIAHILETHYKDKMEEYCNNR